MTLGGKALKDYFKNAIALFFLNNLWELGETINMDPSQLENNKLFHPNFR